MTNPEDISAAIRAILPEGTPFIVVAKQEIRFGGGRDGSDRAVRIETKWRIWWHPLNGSDDEEDYCGEAVEAATAEQAIKALPVA